MKLCEALTEAVVFIGFATATAVGAATLRAHSASASAVRGTLGLECTAHHLGDSAEEILLEWPASLSAIVDSDVTNVVKILFSGIPSEDPFLLFQKN